MAAAIINGDRETVQLLLECKANINEPNEKGTTPLFWAAVYAKPEIFELLLQEGANVRSSSDETLTPTKERNAMIVALREYEKKDTKERRQFFPLPGSEEHNTMAESQKKHFIEHQNPQANKKVCGWRGWG